MITLITWIPSGSLNNVQNHAVITVGFSWSHNGIFSEASFKFCLQFPQSLWHISVSDSTICPHHNIAWHPHWGSHRNIHTEKKLKLIFHIFILTGTPFLYKHRRLKWSLILTQTKPIDNSHDASGQSTFDLKPSISHIMQRARGLSFTGISNR